MRVIYKLVMKISILLEFFFSHSLQTSSLYPLRQLQVFFGLDAIDYDNCIKHCLGCVRHTKNTVEKVYCWVTYKTLRVIVAMDWVLRCLSFLKCQHLGHDLWQKYKQLRQVYK